MARYRVGLETRERILSATRTLLARSGIDGVTLKAITTEAGVGAGSFYNLFDSKEAVIFELIREAIAAVDPDPAGAGNEQLEDLVDAFVGFVVDDALVARIYLQLAVGKGLVDTGIADRVLRAHRRRLDRFTAAWRRAVPSLSREQARLRAEHLVAALTGLGLNALLDPGFDLRRHAHLLVAGLRETGGTPSHAPDPMASVTADDTLGVP